MACVFEYFAIEFIYLDNFDKILSSLFIGGKAYRL